MDEIIDLGSLDTLSFGKAFNIARKMGLEVFNWKGKPYTTKLREDVSNSNRSDTISTTKVPISARYFPINKSNTITPQRKDTYIDKNEELGYDGQPVYGNQLLKDNIAEADASRPRLEGDGVYGKIANDMGDIAMNVLPLAGVGRSLLSGVLPTTISKVLPKYINWNPKGAKYLPEVFNKVPLGEKMAEQVRNNHFNPVITELKQALINARSRKSMIKLAKSIKEAENAQQIINRFGAYPKGLEFVK